MSKTPLDTVRAYYEAFNAHDAEGAAMLMTPEVTEWGRPFGREWFVQAHADVFRRFPDARLDLHEVAVSRDQVAAKLAFSGTHLGVGRLPLEGGQMVGVAPTGARFSVLRIDWWRVAEGRVTDRHGLSDDASLLMQLGLIPRRPPFDIPLAFEEPPVVHPQVIDGAEQARNLAVMETNQAAQARGDVDAAASVFAADTRNHGRAAGADRLALIFKTIGATYTRLDAGTGIVNMIAVDDSVIACTERRLRHTGVMRFPIDGGFLFERPPSGRTFVQRHLHWWTLRQGLVVEHRACRDDVGMASQLGLLPAPPPWP